MGFQGGRSRGEGQGNAVSPPGRRLLQPARAFALPFLCALALAAFGVLPSIASNPRLRSSIFGAAAVLLAMTAAAFLSARATRRLLTLYVVLRRQHYLQAGVQATIFCYWGWY